MELKMYWRSHGSVASRHIYVVCIRNWSSINLVNTRWSIVRFLFQLIISISIVYVFLLMFWHVKIQNDSKFFEGQLMTNYWTHSKTIECLKKIINLRVTLSNISDIYLSTRFECSYGIGYLWKKIKNNMFW